MFNITNYNRMSPSPPPLNYRISDLLLRIRLEDPRSQRFENARIFLYTFTQRIEKKVGEIV